MAPLALVLSSQTGRAGSVSDSGRVAYFDALSAPEKTLVWFERSGHEMFADEPDKFNRTMVEMVRPAACANLRAAA